MLIESAHRRDAFRPGIPVRLADGQTWQFPVLPDAGGPEVYELLAAVAEAEDDAGRQLAELALAVHCFSANYELSPRAYQALFHFAPDDAELAASKRAFRALAEASSRRLPARHEQRREPEAAGPSRLVGVAGALSRLAARLLGDRRGASVGVVGGRPRP